MSKKRVSGPHKRIHHFRKHQRPRPKEGRLTCPDCGAPLVPGKLCKCQFGR